MWVIKSLEAAFLGNHKQPPPPDGGASGGVSVDSSSVAGATVAGAPSEADVSTAHTISRRGKFNLGEMRYEPT